MKTRTLIASLLALMPAAAIAQSTIITIPTQSTTPTIPATHILDGHRGIDVELRGSYLYGMGDSKGYGMFAAELAIGKRLSNSFYFGLVGGVWSSTGDGSDPVLPLMIETQAYTRLTKKLRLTAGLGLGYGINTAADIHVPHSHDVIHMPNYLLWSLHGGMQIAAMRQVDISLGAMMGVMVPVGGDVNGEGSVYIGPRIALNFHRGEQHARKPIRDSGMQLTVEGEMDNSEQFTGLGPAMAVTYKWDPHLSFGLGGGYSHSWSDSDDAYTEQVHFSGNKVGGGYSPYADVEHDSFHFFARGQWRLTDKRLSPVASLDMGLRHYSISQDIGLTSKKNSHTLPYAKPQVGLSLRLLSNNIYLEGKVGYQLAAGIDGDVEVSLPDRATYDAVMRHPINTSGLCFSLGLVSTMNILPRR